MYARADLLDRTRITVFSDAIALLPGFIDKVAGLSAIKGKIIFGSQDPNLAEAVKYVNFYYVDEVGAQIYQMFSDENGDYEIKVPGRRTKFFQVVLTKDPYKNS